MENKEVKKEKRDYRKIIVFIAVLLLLLSGNGLSRVFWSKVVNEQANTEISEIFAKAESSSTNANAEGVSRNFEPLLEVNGETKAWLKVPGTPIDNVVVQRVEDIKNSTDFYYLSNDFYGKHSKYGTLFFGIDNRIEKEYISQNLTIHGHHMRNGQMFGELDKFRELSFYKEHPVFELDTLYGKGQYKIVSVFLTNSLPSSDNDTVFNYFQSDFDTQEKFMQFVSDIQKRSILEAPVDVVENDKLVTLSTCEYDFDQARLVVVGRKVREGESETVDISNAKENPNPLYPQVWYDKYGGKKPK